MSKFNTITGLRRSGTSMLMVALRQAGIPVLGYRYSVDDVKGPPKDVIEGNPNGFWEVGVLTKESGLTSDCGWLGLEGDLVKVMVESLFRSDPKMLNKSVIILRKPGNVLTSIFKWNEIKIKDMFIISITLDFIDSIGWLRANKKEFIFTFYEDILKRPEKELKRICDFLGRGDPKLGAEWINTGLNRSKAKEYEETKYLEQIYKLAKNNDADGIINLEAKVKNRGKEIMDKYNCDHPFPRINSEKK